MKVEIFVEGGGDSKELQSRCREGFRKLIDKAGFAGRMPRFIACGSRNDTYDSFRTAIAGATSDEYEVLLVDSEEPVATDDTSMDSPAPWAHLKERDGWPRPAAAANDQAQLMATCMETWLIADRATLTTVFGSQLHKGALLPYPELESRQRETILHALEDATKPCGWNKMYRKGPKSFDVLAQVSPNVLREHLPHFRRFIDTLNRRLI